MTIIYIFLAGAFGATLRYLLSRFNQSFPWGTLLANISGVALIAFFLSEISGDTQIVLTAGFAGALTTVSTFGMELKQLPRLTAWIYAVVTMISCFIVFNLTNHLF